MGGRREDGTGGPDPQYGGATLLASAEGGRCPAASSLLVSGTEGTVLVDPSLEVGRRGGLHADVGLVVLTHAHEDHVAGLHVFLEVPVVAHPAEVASVRDPETLLAGFGMAAADADVVRRQLHETLARPVTSGWAPPTTARCSTSAGGPERCSTDLGYVAG